MITKDTTPQELLIAVHELEKLSDYNLMTLAALGIMYGYPACCIYEFCIDFMHNRQPAKLRGLSDEPTKHVPCSKCASK